VVVQTPENLAAVARLLDQARGAKVQILVKSIVFEGDAFLNAMKNPPKFAGLYTLSDEDAKAVLEAQTSDKNSAIVSRPMLLTNAGEEAVVFIGQQVPSIIGYVDSGVKKDGVEVFTPIVTQREVGLKLGVTAKVMDSVKPSFSASVDFGITGVIQIGQTPWPDAPPGRADLVLSGPMLSVSSRKSSGQVEQGTWMMMYLPLLGQTVPGAEPMPAQFDALSNKPMRPHVLMLQMKLAAPEDKPDVR
jgi:hypothetical protein